MIITIALKRCNDRSHIELQVNENQRLWDTMAVLEQAGLIPRGTADRTTHLYSERNRQRCNTRLTYREAEIYQGDVLICEEGGQS